MIDLYSINAWSNLHVFYLSQSIHGIHYASVLSVVGEYHIDDEEQISHQKGVIASKCPTSYTDAAVSMGKYCYQKGRSLLVSVEQFYLFRSIQIHDADSQVPPTPPTSKIFGVVTNSDRWIISSYIDRTWPFSFSFVPMKNQLDSMKITKSQDVSATATATTATLLPHCCHCYVQ